MTCGHVLLAHPSPDLYGSDRMLVESVRALHAAGCRVTVALPEHGPLVPLLVAAGAQVVLLPTAVLRKAALRPRGLLVLAVTAVRTLPGMLRTLRALRPDLVYVNTVTLPGWLLAARLARVPAVAHVHEAEPALRPPVAAALNAPLLLARLVLVNSAAARVAVSAALPVLSRRLRLLYNGVPGPPTPAAPPGEQPPTPPVRLVLVGRLSQRKGTDVAIDAVRLLHRAGTDVHLDLVGGAVAGAKNHLAALQAQVAAAGLGDRVRFAGLVADVWPWLAAADIVLVPSRIEPFGNVAVEAALARRPVVAAAVQGLREIVADGRTGVLVPPGDPAALAGAVDSLVADWPRAVSMAAAAHEQAQRRFGVEAYAAGLLALLVEAGLPARATPRP